ncbi:MAG: hypothetical protein ACRCUY_14165 [Thermoguttaceae bacterium]
MLPLGGTVTFPDGTPLTTGRVCLTTETFMADGELKPDGTYDIGSYREKDGLPPGKYKVVINGAYRYEGDDTSPAGVKQIPLVKKDYYTAETTPLQFEVKSGERRFDFTVEKP